MSKVKLTKEKNKDIYLFSTDVDNIFINEIMPTAPGDYVKVYLLGLMHAERGIPVQSDILSRLLGLSISEIDEAWNYWEKNGVIRRTGTRESEEYEIEFVSLISAVYGAKHVATDVENVYDDSEKHDESQVETEAEDESVVLANQELRALNKQYEEVSGKTISHRDVNKIADAVNVYNIKPDVLSYSIKYCAELQKYNIDYMFTVALRWTEAGCKNIADVKAHLDKHSKRGAEYKAIFDELGFSRPSNPGDREIMDRWLDTWNLKLSEILDACRASAGLREPSLKYVNKVLENRRLEEGGIRPDYSGERKENAVTGSEVSRKVLDDYFKHLQQEGERVHRECVEQLCYKLPDIDKIIRTEKEVQLDMLSVGFGGDAKLRRAEMRNKLSELDDQKRNILVNNGYPENYLDRKYKCNKCKDTGITDEGRFCECVEERTKEAFEWYKKIRQELNQQTTK